MKKIFITMIFLLLMITPNVYALTQDGEFVYTEKGAKITYEDYKILRKYYHYRDTTIDHLIDKDNVDYYVTHVKKILYSNKFLVKVTFYSKTSSGKSVIPKEDGYELIEKNIKEENEYKICKPMILMEKLTVEYNIRPEDKDILTNEPLDYDKYCDPEEILAMKAYDEKINKEEQDKEKSQNKTSYIKYYVLVGIITLVLIVSGIVYIKKKSKND